MCLQLSTMQCLSLEDMLQDFQKHMSHETMVVMQNLVKLAGSTGLKNCFPKLLISSLCFLTQEWLKIPVPLFLFIRKPLLQSKQQVVPLLKIVTAILEFFSQASVPPCHPKQQKLCVQKSKTFPQKSVAGILSQRSQRLNPCCNLSHWLWCDQVMFHCMCCFQGQGRIYAGLNFTSCSFTSEN